MWPIERITLKLVDFAIVGQYAGRAAREGVSVKPSESTDWFMAEGPAGPVGFAGLLWVSLSRARIKGVYVFPSFRGNGWGTAMTETLMTNAAHRGASALEVLAYNPAFYEARGFMRVGDPRANGAVRMTRGVKGL